MIEKRHHHTSDRLDIGTEVAVDRRTDHHYDVLATLNRFRVGGCYEPPRGENTGKSLWGLSLGERHRAGIDPVNNTRVGVVQNHVEPHISEREPQWQTYVAAPTDNDDVVIEGHGICRRVAAVGSFVSRPTSRGLRPCAGGTARFGFDP